MTANRRQFLKYATLTGLSVTAIGKNVSALHGKAADPTSTIGMIPSKNHAATGTSLIGPYGNWAASLIEKTPSFSFRNETFRDLASWKKEARQRVLDRMGIPDIGPLPQVKTNKQRTFDGLHIEEVTWQLPYGRPTEAIILKPANISGRLPAILAFHDHGGNKYFGTRKITNTGDQHPMMSQHQRDYYEGRAWANDIARRGYVVLVSDAFPFASRRVMMQDVPEHLRQGLKDSDPEKQENIDDYNDWAGRHEHIMAKSLFSAGTTWPGVFFAEDSIALDILCARNDVDASRVGCAGLSGGGMRTVFMGGLDPRIKCAVCVGFMTTWKDFVLNKSFTHTWMTYVPLLPNELDFPEILGLRAPLPTLVLNDEHDALYTMPEMRRADVILRDVFKKANASENYACSFYPGPHKFDAKMQEEAFDWFDKWLQ